MSWIIIAIIGAIVGWIASYAISPERRTNLALNIIAGAVGAILGVWFFAGVLGLITSSAGVNFWLAILWAIVGALILMAIVAAIAGRYSRRERFEETKMGRGIPHQYDRDEEYEEKYTRRKK